MTKKTMMKFGIIAIAASVIATGCGESPEDIAESYVTAWNDGDVEAVKEMLSPDATETLDNRLNRCLGQKMSGVIDQRYKEIKKKVAAAWSNHNPYSKEMEPTADEIKELSKTEEEAKKTGKDFLMASADAYIKTVSAVKTSGLSKELNPLELKYYAFLIANHQAGFAGAFDFQVEEIFEDLITDELRENGSDILEKSEKACAKEVFAIDTITDVNIIETKEISADKKTVRTEIIKGEAASKKNINMEMLNKEWKIDTLL